MKALFALVLLAAVAGHAAAQQASGTVAVTGTVTSSLTIALTSVPGAATDGQTTLGTFGYFRPIVTTTGFTYSRSGNLAVYSASLTVQTLVHGSSSPSYTLQGSFSGAMPSGVSWTLGGVTLTSTPATIASQVAYGETSYPWTIRFSDTAAAGSYSTTLLLTAISN